MALLRKGDRGPAVVDLQKQLNAIGYNLATDGIFGNGTDQAVRKVQSGAGLVVDGVVGPKTVYAIQNAGDRHVDHLTEDDLVQAARDLGCELAAIKAVNQVEARGSGYTKSGDLKMLFERHIMFRQLTNKYGLDRANQLAAQYPDVVNKSAGGYTTNERARLEKAVTIDAECAYASASYGLFQIMGFNGVKVCGYPTAKAFYMDMLNGGESAHLRAFVQFIKADNNLLTALRTKNWASFARWYNGPNYAADGYDKKLAAAYASFV
ncbi:peptidoglycan binding protein [Serratia phage 2050H1]|uniref:Peptidoglycan binding protein n=1 Tax=Serratia phage 2050H1 TaxID=2024250 RepID=A0A249Y2K3_9CAUD|nr:peptidoglycan binding protein [Serratia phage 2050H1]